jgi:hypothetical protein
MAFPMKPLSCAVLSMVISALAVPMRSSAQTTHDRDVHELERLETVWNEAHEHGDADVLEKLWADNMEVAVPKMPVLTKADAVKFARSGHMKFLKYGTSDIRVRVYENAAVVTGRLQRTRSRGRENAVPVTSSNETFMLKCIVLFMSFTYDDVAQLLSYQPR